MYSEKEDKCNIPVISIKIHDSVLRSNKLKILILLQKGRHKEILL